MRLRNWLLPSLLLNAALILLVTVEREPAPVSAGVAATSSENGDLDGNESRDIGDVLYLLNHLFKGGPAPVPFETTEAPPAALPETGQNRCYDGLGNEVLCNNTEFPGQDGFYRAGCGGSERFVAGDDDTLIDTCTGLQWTSTTQDINGDIDFDARDLVTWQEALRFCEDRDLAGHADWRLPNRREIESLAIFADRTPGIDSRFTLISPHLYWTSTSDITSPSSAWFIEFDRGGTFLDSTSKSGGRFHVLCVRTVTP